MPDGGTTIITPDALIARLDARDRHVAGKFILSDRSEPTARSVGDCAPGHLFDAPDHPAACDRPFHDLGNTQ